MRYVWQISTDRLFDAKIIEIAANLEMSRGKVKRTLDILAKEGTIFVGTIAPV